MESTAGAIRQHYEGRTSRIIARYGPGPRVHYHMTYFDTPPSAADPSERATRARLAQAQERLLERAAEFWDIGRYAAGQLLDIGCGVGGGSIYWAQRLGARVTACTISPEQIPAVAAFSRQARVGHLVTPLLADVCELAEDGRYDAAVAVESLCHMPVDQALPRIRAALRTGGGFFVEDGFVVDRTWRMPFNDYFACRVGTFGDFVTAAGHAGLAVEDTRDITRHTRDFWLQTLTLLDFELERCAEDGPEHARLLRSVHWHSRFLRAWYDGSIESRLVRLRAV
ncbi:methyltransferase domain-containing protein [Streptomyces netropsis]|uniref:SAM-dependent methyltransferase n=1 Tax=Streptomyces netropsis TaxID=55404 RepID=UPI0030D2E67C